MRTNNANRDLVFLAKLSPDELLHNSARVRLKLFHLMACNVFWHMMDAPFSSSSPLSVLPRRIFVHAGSHGVYSAFPHSWILGAGN